MADYFFTVWVEKGRALETVHGPSCVTVTGYTAEEYRQDPTLWIRMVHEEDRAMVQAQTERVLAGEQAQPLEHRIWRKDGEMRWVRNITVPHYDAQGRLISYDGLISDITARKTAEQELKEERDFSNTIIESLPGTFFLIDTQRRFIRWNKNQEIYMGYSPEELHSMDALETIYEADRAFVTEKIQEIFEQGQAQFEARVRFKQGGPRYALITTKRLDIQGKAYIVGTGIDMEARKRSEEVRHKLQSKLVEAQRMESIGRLAGGVAHDFNNLLTPIIGYAELVLRDLKPGDSHYAELSHIIQAAERAKDLTLQLLAFGRKQVLEMKTINLAQALGRFENLLRRTIREDIRINISTPPSLGLIRADIGQIEQMLMNLAVNAQDAMPMGGVLSIELSDVVLDEGHASQHPEIKPGSYVMLAIKDTGYGMDSDTLKRLFEPFFTTKDMGKGSGLGLAIVYGIVKQHGGTISVHSEPGRGSTFSVYLPRAMDQRASPSQVPQEGAELRFGSETVLVCEDDRTLRDVISQMLTHLGYQVLVVDRPEACPQCIATHPEPIHLLLTDVIMPGMDGKEVYEQLHTLYPDIKVLYVSGYPGDIIATHGILDKGIFFLQKPFTLQALSDKLRQVLDS